MTQYTHIRNATGKLTIKNTTFLIDPFLAPKDTYPGFEGTFNYQQRMPIVDLPLSMDQLLSDVDAVVVTHTHLDHWDDSAVQAIPKSLPILYKIQRIKNSSALKVLMMCASFLKVWTLTALH